MTHRPHPVAPSAAFTHPLFAIALITLVLNDHVLKGAGVLPGVLTGKVSDVVGLLVAPAVLAWVARVRTIRGWTLAHVAVGIGFSALELSPALVAAVERAAALIHLPVRMWPDPTDLLALPSLAVSYVVLRAEKERRPATAVGVLALLACTATSAQPPPPRYPYRARGIIPADVFVRHTESDPLQISVKRLRDGVEIDCDALMEAPERATDRDDFTSEKEWTLARGDGVPLWDRPGGAPTRDCYAVRLRAHDREWLLVWRHGTPPIAQMPLRLEADVPAEPQAVIVREGDEPPRVPSGVVLRRL